MSRRDFRAYMKSPEFRRDIRLTEALANCLWANNPKTLTDARRCMRETFPEWYRKFSWLTDRTGKESVDIIWGYFVQWQARL